MCGAEFVHFGGNEMNALTIARPPEPVFDVPDPDPGLIATCGPFEHRPTCATPVRPATFEEWLDAMTWCQSAQKASPFWIGDLELYAEAHGFDEEASQALDGLDYADKS